MKLLPSDRIDDWITCEPTKPDTGQPSVGQPEKVQADSTDDLSPSECQAISEGLKQRVRLLNLILADLYGPQNSLKQGHLPPDAVFAHPWFLLPFHDMEPAGGKHIHIYAAEIARVPDGQWWVMADRSEAPSGAGYAVENRIVASRTWPHLIQDCRVQRLASFFMAMQENLQSLAKHHRENPRIVLLTQGPKHPYYFEDAFLSQYLGYTRLSKAATSRCGTITSRSKRWAGCFPSM